MFFLNVQFNNKSFSSPSVVFVASFLLSAMWACAYSDKWDLSLSFSTFIVISIYLFVFSLVCLIAKQYDNARLFDSSSEEDAVEIQFEKWKIILYLLFEIIIILSYARRISVMTGKSIFAEAISSAYVERTEMFFPFYLRISLAFIRGGGYWFSYVLVSNTRARHKLDVMSFFVVAFSILATSLTGSRGTGVCVLLSIVAYMLLFEYRSNKTNRRLNVKMILSVLLIMGLLLWLFPHVNTLLGRVNESNPMDYLATYVGAEIYNLDSFITHSDIPANSGTWGSVVFNSIETTLSKYFGFNVTKPYSAFPFRHQNGYFLGNVYTALYEPLYDFGYIGCLIIIILYAIFSQRIFDKATTIPITGKNIPSSILMYGYLFPIIAVSFFAWWFGIYIVSTTFLYIFISWKIYDVFFFRISLKLHC